MGQKPPARTERLSRFRQSAYAKHSLLDFTVLLEIDMSDDNVTHIITAEMVGMDRLASFDTKGQAGPGVTFEIACKEVLRLTAEASVWRKRYEALEIDHDRTYEAYVALLNEVGRLNPLAIKKGRSD